MDYNNKWLNSLTAEDRELYKNNRRIRDRERYVSDIVYRTKSNKNCNKGYKNKRAAVVEYLGGRCSNPDCKWVNNDGTYGCTDHSCLQIDHVNSNGAVLRKSKDDLSGRKFYRKVFDTIPGVEYQLLCANCNWIKRVDSNEVVKPRTNFNDSWNGIDLRTIRKRDAKGHFLPSEEWAALVASSGQ